MSTRFSIQYPDVFPSTQILVPIPDYEVSFLMTWPKFMINVSENFLVLYENNLVLSVKTE